LFKKICTNIVKNPSIKKFEHWLWNKIGCPIVQNFNCSQEIIHLTLKDCKDSLALMRLILFYLEDYIKKYTDRVELLKVLTN
jgi:hypothetical protein